MHPVGPIGTHIIASPTEVTSAIPIDVNISVHDPTSTLNPVTITLHQRVRPVGGMLVDTHPNDSSSTGGPMIPPIDGSHASSTSVRLTSTATPSVSHSYRHYDTIDENDGHIPLQTTLARTYIQLIRPEWGLIVDNLMFQYISADPKYAVLKSSLLGKGVRIGQKSIDQTPATRANTAAGLASIDANTDPSPGTQDNCWDLSCHFGTSKQPNNNAVSEHTHIHIGNIHICIVNIHIVNIYNSHI